MIDTAVKAFLAADATLAAMLGTYKGAPAIFVHGAVPPQFDRSNGKPYIALRDEDAGPYLDGDRDFFITPVDVFVLGLDQGDANQVEAAAKRVRDLLDVAAIAPSGYTSAGTVLDSGPRPDDPDDLTFGRRMRVIVGLIETG